MNTSIIVQFYEQLIYLSAGDATTNLGPHFHWIKQPQIIHGVEALRLSGEQLRKQLYGKS